MCVFELCRLNVFVGAECCKHGYSYMRKISDLSDNKVSSSSSALNPDDMSVSESLPRHWNTTLAMRMAMQNVQLWIA